MRTIGIDSGSTTTKGVLMEDGQLTKRCLIPTSARPGDSIQEVYQRLSGEGADRVVTTGYGRALLSQADKKVTEITCHGKGAAWLLEGARSVIDIGGQDCKVMLLGQGGRVTDFLMNDKCAAGTGRFVEMMMRIMEVPMEGLDAFVEGRSPIPVTSMCTVFAESEIISLLAEGADPGSIAMGMIHAICKRTAYFAKKINPIGPVFFTGGLAGCRCFCQALSQYLQLPVHTDPLSQYAGAIGAALL
ncbi:MAG: acyl-CoA dehydratase activase [Eubacteriales bacterium]|nr:acyl-CoA dehydratase activase [Eubacteriales bacterium]